MLNHYPERPTWNDSRDYDDVHELAAKLRGLAETHIRAIHAITGRLTADQYDSIAEGICEPFYEVMERECSDWGVVNSNSVESLLYPSKAFRAEMVGGVA